MSFRHSLETYLVSNEKVINQISPVSYLGTPYHCAVTNFRILLYRTDKQRHTEIEHQYIASSTLEKAKYNGLSKAGGYCLGFGIALVVMLFLPYISGFIPIFLPILLIVLGIILLILYGILDKHFVLIRGAGGNFLLFSRVDLLEQLINTIRNIRHGAITVADRPKIDINIQPKESAPATDQKFCIHCGASIRANASFCDKCGKKQE